jgi:hypothetical protein
LVYDVFSPPLCAGVVVLFALKVTLDHLLDAGSNLARVESKALKVRVVTFHSPLVPACRCSRGFVLSRIPFI